MGFFRKVVLVLLVSCASSEYAVEELATSSKTFSINLYKNVANQQGNILVSPSSLHTILSLLDMGAKGSTFQELSRTLAIPIHKGTIYQLYKQLHLALKTASTSTLNSANKIFISNLFKINPDFLKAANEAFDAEAESLNFSKDKAGAVQDINSWVARKTYNKIRELVKEEHINENTMMILINALHFNGVWDRPFDPMITLKRKFFLNATHWETTQIMVNDNSFKYLEDEGLDCKFLEVPYAGNEFSMTFVLPNKRDGLPALERRLEEVFQERELDEREVIISIPKFKIEQETDLKTVLQNMGLRKIFSYDAELSDLSATNRTLYVSRVLQKTFIDVNEKGTQAAAATSGDITDRIGGTRPSFLADHPFMFYLKQSTTGIVHFIGRFSQPEKIYNY